MLNPASQKVPDDILSSDYSLLNALIMGLKTVSAALLVIFFSFDDKLMNKFVSIYQGFQSLGKLGNK